MTTKAMIKKLKLSEKDFADIKDAVNKAESRTTGEIVIGAAPESSSYAFWELMAACITAITLLICLFPLAGQIYNWLNRIFWGTQPWYLAAFYMIVCAIVTAVLYALYNVPFFDNLIIPGKVKDKAVNDRAMRFFAESNVYATKEHSGILIFVSAFEKQVRIVADTGISSKISQDLWNLIADELCEDLRKGNASQAFINAINRCGDLLAESFPNHKDNPNELGDGLIILEDEKWQ